MRRGFPIRTSADQRSLASPRGFSQRATSFIASWRQGIHRTPFFHSPSPHPATHTQYQTAPNDPNAAIILITFANQSDTLVKEQRRQRNKSSPAGLLEAARASAGQPDAKAAPEGSHAGHRERRAEPVRLACSLKDRSQPEGIRPRRHDTILERR